MCLAVNISLGLPSQKAHGRSVSSEELLDEDDHLGFLDGTGVILIEGSENFIESFLGELVTGSEVTEGILNELLGLFLIEGT